MKLQEIEAEVVGFSRERDWDQFHNPKDLALAVSIEAAELLEIFQWKNDALSQQEVNHAVSEIADVAQYLILLCRKLDTDLETVIMSKLAANKARFPVEESRGKAKSKSMGAD